MKFLQLFSCVTLMCVTSTIVKAKSTSTSNETAGKRNVLQFAAMTYYTTNRLPNKYVGYGCYCGLGGYGIPVDKNDECCRKHDLCYKDVEDSHTCPHSWDIYTTIYKREGAIDCSQENNPCKLAVCKCDSVAAKCLGEHKDSFQEQYKGYDKKKKCDPMFTL